MDSALRTGRNSGVSSVHWGGDPEIWGRVAHLAGGAGHPQLTHAFTAGLAARSWPVNEIAEMVARGFTNNDLEDEHSAVRANLIDSLPEPTRRASLSTKHYNRAIRAFSRPGDWNTPTAD